MSTYAVVENDGKVSNIINWDGKSHHAHSSKFVLNDGTAWVGATWDGTSFSQRPSTRTFESVMIQVRARRDALLLETDWYGLEDVVMPTEMATYRQELRDMTNGLETVEDALSVHWPVKPE